jgi:ParB family chromosome partitioning protein
MSGKRRPRLGRGLDALLAGDQEPKAGTGTGTGTGVLTVSVHCLKADCDQPRGQIDEAGIEELAASIRVQGVIQPLVVTPAEETTGGPRSQGGNYVIIAGERRWRAAQRAGLDVVPVVVREIRDRGQLLELALVENLQRADLNPIEEATAYQTLADVFGLSQEEIARRVGKARATVTNALRLLRLPAAIREMLRDGRLTPGQARPLVAVADPDRQLQLAEQAVAKGLSARALESLAAKDGRSCGRRRPEPDSHTRELMAQLSASFQTRVDIVRGRRVSQIRIHFQSEQELIEIFERLKPGSPAGRRVGDA